MDCPKCGAKLAPGALFCTKCGAQFPKSAVQDVDANQQMTDSQDAAPSPKKGKGPQKKVLVIGLVAAVVVLVVVAVAIFLSINLSPEKRLIKALENGDYAAAADIISDDISLRSDGTVEDILLERIQGLRQDYVEKKISYDALTDAIASIRKLRVKAVSDELDELVTFADALEVSRGYYAAGDSLFNDGDFMAAIEQYRLVYESDPDHQSAQDMIQKCIDGHRQNCLDEAAKLAADGDITGAISFLERKLKDLPDDQQILEQIQVYEADLDVQNKTNVLEEAEAHAKDGEYEEAIAVLEKYLRTVLSDTDVEKKLEEYRASFEAQQREEALSEAESCVTRGDIAKALDILNGYLEENGEHPDVTKAYDAYKELYVTKTIQEAADAETNHLALKKIMEAQQKVEDSRLDAEKLIYETAYVDDVVKEADAYVEQMQFDQATSVLMEAVSLLPDNEILMNKIQEVEGAEPVSLASLTPINGSFPWNEGTPEDPFGNSYSDVQNYAIFHASRSYHDREQTYFIEYKVDEQYNCLNFVISPYSDFGENASSYLQVFVNGSLRYTSPKIYQKTEPLQVPGIDVSDATYVKIVVYVGGHGCVMLSDVTLNNPVGFTSQLDGSLISLAVMDTFNGSLPWYNEFPADARNNDYFHCCNYAVLHSARSYHDRAQTYSAEYYLAKGYSYLALDIAPATDFGEAGSTVVKIYVNDELRYTSPTITQKTTKLSTGKIDLTGADYVKIVIEVQGHSCTIISNAVLKKNEQQ